MWPDKQKRDEFFDELRALLNKYPNLANYQARKYAFDAANMEAPGDGYPVYDPASPMFLQGVVVLLTHSNMENYEDLQILDPYEQSHYLTVGMLSRASTEFGFEDIE